MITFDLLASIWNSRIQSWFALFFANYNSKYERLDCICAC